MRGSFGGNAKYSKSSQIEIQGLEFLFASVCSSIQHPGYVNLISQFLSMKRTIEGSARKKTCQLCDFVTDNCMSVV